MTLPLPNRLAYYARRGWHGRHWYQRMRRFAVRRVGPAAAPIWLACFALTSPNCTVASNLTLADKALRQWQRGEHFTGYLPSVAMDLERFRHDPRYRPKGRKVRAFMRNLLGNPQPVTIDRWIGRAAGLKDIPEGQTWQAVKHAIRQLAGLCEVTPAEMQAAIWTGIREASRPLVLVGESPGREESWIRTPH
jgi:hypothetical protein